MPEGARCLTARNAKERIMPDRATGAQHRQRRQGAGGIILTLARFCTEGARRQRTRASGNCGGIADVALLCLRTDHGSAPPFAHGIPRPRCPRRAERAADMLDALIARHPGRQLLHVSQMRRCLQSIAANISEGFGRGKGRDRNRSLEIARGETERRSGTSVRTTVRAESTRASTGRFTISW